MLTTEPNIIRGYGILVCLSCCNRDWVADKQQESVSQSLEAGVQGQGPAWSDEGYLPGHRLLTSTCVLTWWEELGNSLGPFYKEIILARQCSSVVEL